MKPERKDIMQQKEHPDYGRVKRTADNKLICHICGKAFIKLGAHVTQKHGITSWEYKIMFGLDTTKGLISEEHKQHLNSCVMRHYDKCVKENLINDGRNSRFVPGCKGRTKDLVSFQTKQVLIKNTGRLKRHNNHGE